MPLTNQDIEDQEVEDGELTDTKTEATQGQFCQDYKNLDKLCTSLWKGLAIIMQICYFQLYSTNSSGNNLIY